MFVTEIVAYAENSAPTIPDSSVYPESFTAVQLDKADGNSMVFVDTFTYNLTYNGVSNIPCVFAVRYVSQSSPAHAGSGVVQLLLVNFDGQQFLGDTGMDVFGTAYYNYIFSGYPVQGTWHYYLTKIDNPTGYPDLFPYGNDSGAGYVADGIIDILYSLGFSFVNSGNVLADILNFSINGKPFVELLFSGGFVLFLSWSVIKWLRPW